MVLMGGAIGEGNVTAAAEFNSYVDPESAQRVFSSGIDLTMVGLDVTYRAIVSPAKLEELRGLGRAGGVVAAVLDAFPPDRRYSWYPEGYPMHDAVAVAELVRPGLLTTEYLNVVVDCSSELSRGRTVVDRRGRSGREPNARVAVDVDTAAFVAPDRRRRQLHRSRIRSDVPALRRRGHHHRDGPRLIGREDEDVSTAIREIVEHEGVEVRVNAKCISFAKRGEEIAAGIDCADGAPQVHGTHVLLAVGRRPNTDDLGLEEAGVAVDDRGYVVVDDQLRTSVPGIWALGDCNGKGAFTHTSYNDGEIVIANLLENDPRRVSDRIAAYALYVDPPLGRAGMTEAEIRTSGRKALIAKRPMTRVGRAVEKGETQGFMKIAVDAETGAILAPRSSARAATRSYTRFST